VSGLPACGAGLRPRARRCPGRWGRDAASAPARASGKTPSPSIRH